MTKNWNWVFSQVPYRFVNNCWFLSNPDNTGSATIFFYTRINKVEWSFLSRERRHINLTGKTFFPCNAHELLLQKMKESFHTAHYLSQYDYEQTVWHFFQLRLNKKLILQYCNSDPTTRFRDIHKVFWGLMTAIYRPALKASVHRL